MAFGLRAEALGASPTVPTSWWRGTVLFPKELHGSSLTRFDSSHPLTGAEAPCCEFDRPNALVNPPLNSEEFWGEPCYRFRRIDSNRAPSLAICRSRRKSSKRSATRAAIASLDGRWFAATEATLNSHLPGHAARLD